MFLTFLKSLNPSWYERMKMAREVAQGMVWLHDVTKIVHGDLKPANLLVFFIVIYFCISFIYLFIFLGIFRWTETIKLR